MAVQPGDLAPHQLPGTTAPKSVVPEFHYELLVCGLRGHELVGTDARTIRDQDSLVVRPEEGFRWHRCLRCDSWLPIDEPGNPTREHPPERDQVELPLRGKPLRDKIVLRLIAVNRAFHFVVFALLAVAIFLFSAHRSQLHDTFFRVVTDIQHGLGGPIQGQKVGLAKELDHLFSLRSSSLHLLGAGLVVYAALEGTEAVGLWLQRRWAEYLTFLATILLLPLEIYELAHRVSPLKIVALIVNLAIAAYLLRAKRLFGLNGGVAAEHAAREHDVGWAALERNAPERAVNPRA